MFLSLFLICWEISGGRMHIYTMLISISSFLSWHFFKFGERTHTIYFPLNTWQNQISATRVLDGYVWYFIFLPEMYQEYLFVSSLNPIKQSCEIKCVVLLWRFSDLSQWFKFRFCRILFFFFLYWLNMKLKISFILHKSDKQNFILLF